MLAPTAAPRVDPKLRAHTFCHVAPELWYLIGVVLSAGGAFGWYRDQCARELQDSDRRDDVLVAEAATIPPGADGLTFLPYLQGERTPHRDASLRAAFLGLSLAHSRAHMTRAVLEGVCFALRDSLEILTELGLAPAVLLLTGGGAKSPFIRQLQADVFGLPVTTVNREEGGSYGAALLAAVGTGAFPDLQTAAQRTLSRQPPASPNREVHKAYEPIYDRFRKRLVAARA
jgi:xylulokinase